MLLIIIMYYLQFLSTLVNSMLHIKQTYNEMKTKAMVQLHNWGLVYQFENKGDIPYITGAPVAQWVKCWPTYPQQSRVRAPLKAKSSQPQTGFHCKELFIIIRPPSWYNWNTFEKDVKSRHPSTHPFIHNWVNTCTSIHDSWIETDYNICHVLSDLISLWFSRTKIMRNNLLFLRLQNVNEDPITKPT